MKQLTISEDTNWSQRIISFRRLSGRLRCSIATSIAFLLTGGRREYNDRDKYTEVNQQDERAAPRPVSPGKAEGLSKQSRKGLVW